MKEFKVGQKAWSIELGECDVVKINGDNIFNNITCKNKEKNRHRYLPNGYSTICNKSPSLFHSNPFEKQTDLFELAKEKGFELIMEDMWCWDDKEDIENAALVFVICMKSTLQYKYLGVNAVFKNASKEDPRIKKKPEQQSKSYI